VLESSYRRVLCAGRARVPGGILPRTAEDAARWEEDVSLPSNAHAWATVFTGSSTFAVIKGLFANTVYRVRVVAFSSAGSASRPSFETQVVTLDNGHYIKHCRQAKEGCEQRIANYAKLVVEAHEKTGVDPWLILAKMVLSSGLNPKLVHPKTGAFGLVAIHPKDAFLTLAFITLFFLISADAVKVL
jgi:hypothetical protein